MKKQILILIALIGLLFLYYHISEPTEVDTDITISQEITDREPTRYVCVGEFCDGSGYADGGYTRINIPLVQDGNSFGCGADIFFAPHTVAPTTAVLDASYRLLFDLKAIPEIPSDGFRNPIGSYTKLRYDSVNLKDGIAKLYLEGSLYGPGHCSLPELRTQVTENALQYDTVSRIEVYLNGSLYDWCEEDMSDGEGYCSQGPDYWVGE